MPITEKIIYVYDHFSFDEPKLLGKLFVNTIKKEDLLELWKRIVFNMSVSNTDDHLRNHAFILKRNGGFFRLFTMLTLYHTAMNYHLI